MTPEELFSAEPMVDIKRKPKPARAKKRVPTFDEIEEATGVRPDHRFTVWHERDEATRKADIAHEVNYIIHKRATSVNFKRAFNKRIQDRNYRVNGYKTKICNDCGKLRGITYFDKLKDPKKGKDVRRPYCFACRQKMNKAAYQRRKNDTH